MRRTALLSLLLAGCSIIPPDRQQGPRPSPAVEAENPARFRQCLADIAALGAKVEALPDRTYPNGCSATSA